MRVKTADQSGEWPYPVADTLAERPFSSRTSTWDHAGMSKEQHLRRTGNRERTDTEQHSLSTAEIRAVAQRREDAEEKLERHLRESEHKATEPDDDGGV